jgi:hypothetical protein
MACGMPRVTLVVTWQVSYDVNGVNCFDIDAISQMILVVLYSPHDHQCKPRATRSKPPSALPGTVPLVLLVATASGFRGPNSEFEST